MQKIQSEPESLEAAGLLKQMNTKNYQQIQRIFSAGMYKVRNIPPAANNYQFGVQPKELTFSSCQLKFSSYSPQHVEGTKLQFHGSPPVCCACGCTQLSSEQLLQNFSTYQKQTVYYNKQPTYPDLTSLPLPSQNLVFESRFESGNLFSAQRLKICTLQNEFSSYEQVYVLIIQPDSHSTSHSQWFNFLVKNANPQYDYTFLIINFVKKSSSYQSGMSVLVKDDNNWAWSGRDIVYKKNASFMSESESFRSYHSLGFKLRFQSGKVHQISQNYPYPYSRLNFYLNKYVLFERNDISIQRTVLCRTQAGNEIDMITITNKPVKERKIIYITSRIHPGETQSSYIAEGLVNFLLSADQVAYRLRNHFTFKIIPLLNPDGVIVGNYRCNLAGFDLNRNWHQTSKHTPCIESVQSEMKLDSTHELFCYIDVHGHFKKKSVFGYSVNDDGFFQFLHSYSQFFKFQNCKLGYSKSKKNTGRVINGTQFGFKHSYCIEASFHGWTNDENEQTSNSDSDENVNEFITEKTIEKTISDKRDRMTTPWTQESLRKVGEDIAAGLRFFIPGEFSEEQTQKIIQKVESTARASTKDDASDSDEDIELAKNKKIETILQKEIGIEKMGQTLQSKSIQIEHKVKTEEPVVKRMQSAPTQKKIELKTDAYNSQQNKMNQLLRRKELPPQPHKRLVYDKIMDLQSEKQKFEYEFYQRYQGQAIVSSQSVNAVQRAWKDAKDAKIEKQKEKK
ncbi:Zinc_carboxypeptidase domain-containing protein [Hexamita inflata]|uniref:Zinc carboxypeptidase domain-containing protein n=1 Tax=Hexamita inflata TaxID=28002 RepID=A0AA86PDM8_9EUKA|nr:Zinc carboxypeptidase domain-containing protein [Hexamita inflata]